MTSFLRVPSGDSKTDDEEDRKLWSRAKGPRETSIEGMLGNERFADLTLQCTDEKTGVLKKAFRVNRSFMASASDVWRASFYGRFREAARDAVVEMKGVDPAHLECLIRFAYFLDPRVDRYNAMPVRLLAERYQVTGLRRFCDELLSEKSLAPDTVCEMMAAAMQYDLKSLVRACINALEEKFKSKDFERMFESRGFLNMPPTAVLELLNSDRLRVKEEKLYQHLLKWATSQESKAATEALAKAATAAEEETKTDASEEKESVDMMTTTTTAAITDADIAAADSLKKPKIALDFLQIVKPQIRFPVMDMKFLLTEVSATKLLSLEEEHAIMKSLVLETKLCPFSITKRQGVASFEDSTHFVRGTYGSGWGYGGSKDALCLTFDADVFLCGVGIWSPDAGCRSIIRIFDGENGSGHTEVIMFPEQTFAAGKNTTPHPYIFPEPFEMVAGRKYTVELHQHNTSGSSYSTSAGVRTTILEEGVTLTISRASSSPNSTSTTGGALPVFYVSL